MSPLLERARDLMQSGWSIAAAARETGLPVATDQDGRPMIADTAWQADDGSCEVTVDAASAQDAAEAYVDGGEWGDGTTTVWVSVSVWRVGIRAVECAWCEASATGHDSDGDPACADHTAAPGIGVDLLPLTAHTQTERESHKIAIDPTEPECVDGGDHDWQSPHELVGGCESNPGVWGSGGGVRMQTVCMHCGCARTADTWAQDPTDGEQGLTSTSYEPSKYAAEVRS